MPNFIFIISSLFLLIVFLISKMVDFNNKENFFKGFKENSFKIPIKIKIKSLEKFFFSSKPKKIPRIFKGIFAF